MLNDYLHLPHSARDSRSGCKIMGGSPTQSVEVKKIIFTVDKTHSDFLQGCILGDVADGGCDAFIQEECDYKGQETAFSAPPGQITNPTECEDHCLTFQV